MIVKDDPPPLSVHLALQGQPPRGWRGIDGTDGKVMDIGGPVGLAWLLTLW